MCQLGVRVPHSQLTFCLDVTWVAWMRVLAVHARHQTLHGCRGARSQGPEGAHKHAVNSLTQHLELVVTEKVVCATGHGRILRPPALCTLGGTAYRIWGACASTPIIIHDISLPKVYSNCPFVFKQ